MSTLQQELQRGQAYQQAGRRDEAQRCYERALQLHPSSSIAWYLLGTVALTSRDPARAASCFREAVAAQPDFVDAHCNLGAALQTLGQAGGAIAAYRAALRLRPEYAEVHCNLGNALQATGDLTGAITAYREALRLKPMFVEVQNALGVALKADGKLEEAVAAYRQAIALRPEYIAPYLNLALAFEAQGKLDEAIATYREILTRQPALVAAHCNLAVLLQAQGQLDEAIAAYERALALDPTNVEALTNLGTAHQARNDLDAALARYRQALALQPNLAQARFNAAVCLLLDGNLRAGWPGYEARWQCEQGKFKRPFKQPLWLGQTSLEGRTILVYPEQGLGDTLQFVRYVPRLAALGARVVLEVQPPLAGLLSGFSGAHTVVARGEPLPPFDLHCPMLSLPLALGTDLQTIPANVPYLDAPAQRRNAWRTRLHALAPPASAAAAGEPRRVGLVWSGGPHHKSDHLRSIPLERFERRLGMSPVQFVSLQKEVKPADAVVLRSTPQIADVSADLRDFADTAALVAELDLVIAVDTSVAHLAGAMGKPTWILLPFAPDWRWLLGRSDTPWYPTARLFRQRQPGDWEQVLDAVFTELTAWADRT